MRTTAEGAWEDNIGGGGRVREQREDEGGQQWKESGRTTAKGFWGGQQCRECGRTTVEGVVWEDNCGGSSVGGQLWRE